MNSTEQPKRMSKKKEYLLFAIWLIALIGGTELAFRALYHTMDRPYGIVNENVTYLPYVGFRRAPNSTRNVVTYDQYGLPLNKTDEVRNLEVKPDNEFRIFMMGGSTVEGRNLETPDQTLAGRLEVKLKTIFENEHIPLVPKVINAGMSSYYSGNSLASFVYQVLPTKPDFVIYFNGVNDFISWGENSSSAYALFQNNYNDYQAGFFDTYNQFFTLGGTFAAFIKNMTSYSATMDFFYKIFTKFDRFKKIVTSSTGDEKKFDATVEEFMPRIIERYKRNIISSIGVAMPFDAGVSYILQPTMLGVEPLSDDEKVILKSINVKWHNLDYTKARNIFYARSRIMFKELAQRFDGDPSVSIYDLSLLFDSKDSKDSYYSDHAHYYNIAREKIIDDMTGKIAPQIVGHARKRLNKQGG